MNYSGPSILLALLVLAVYGWQVVRGGGRAQRAGLERLAALGRGPEWLLWLLAALALVAHLGILSRPEGGTLAVRAPLLHISEGYHYYLGAKYYSELGNAGLYEATVIADAEDDPSHFDPTSRIRDLASYRPLPRGLVLRRGAQAKQAFSQQRWREFKRDLDFFRRAVSRDVWHDSKLQHDHGYNGTPLTTAILGLLANHVPADTDTFLQLVRWADLVLFALFVAWLSSLAGRRAAAGFAILWLLNPMNEYAYIGQSFLRYNFAWTLGVFLVLYLRGRWLWSGVWLAASALFRLFPVLFAVALAVHHLLQPARRRLLRERKNFFIGLAAAGIALVALTLPVHGPKGRSAWLEFAERIDTHAAAYAFNIVGLQYAFSYDPGHRWTLRRARSEGVENVSWETELAASFEARRPLYLATAVALLAALLAAARRLEPSDLAGACLLGFPLIFVVMYLSHYYWLLLGFAPLLVADRRAGLPCLLALWGAGLVTAGLPSSLIAADLRFLLFNVEIGLALAALTVAIVRAPPAAASDG